MKTIDLNQIEKVNPQKQTQKVSRYSDLLTNQDKGNFFGFITQKEQELKKEYYRII